MISKIQKEIQRFIRKQYKKFKSFIDEPFPYVSKDLEQENNVIIAFDVNIMTKCKIGKYSYISNNSFIGPNTNIGRYCSIAPNVCIAPGQHPTNFLSTHLFQYSYYKEFEGKEKIDFCGHKPTKIGHDVWIGRNVVIMDGVNIGNGAVIGANAVVTKDIPPFAVAGGVPAKIIKYRFSDNLIKQLSEIEWWNLEEEKLKKLPFQDINKCMAMLKEL